MGEHLISADKLIEWLDGPDAAPLWEGPEGLLKYNLVMEEIEAGTFDPTPVQLDIKPGDKVRHTNKNYGDGIVKRLSKSGERAFVTPQCAYYRLDKLIKVEGNSDVNQP
ncbi:hypothetical protein [Paenibacillus rhizophilus]|uniref:Uncharacterized protein n=1 Tax=Paenibacillus rhizophilus TaxID=1850366 RepID=A0A3N9P6H1_9BACL|nr:hypothetical protein [Paenibacillus rhizophilus]RQW11831.1 hypothetical protein EH198_09130 [Paenibacillus rhizophilus]